MSNILQAIYNISQLSSFFIVEKYKNSIRIQQAGDSLEYFIKDAFCGSFTAKNLQEKENYYSKNFSYTGNANNPPDIILKNGDAIEVKKIESMHSTIALNSSYPKNKLYALSPLITKACRECEAWTEKDIIYAIGTVKNKILQSLWLVYGDIYAAEKETYENFLKNVSAQKSRTPSIVDKLGITRVFTSSCTITHPNKVYDYLFTEKNNKNVFRINALIPKEKYLSFPVGDIQKIESCAVNDNFIINDVLVKSPNDTSKVIEAKLIRFAND